MCVLSKWILIPEIAKNGKNSKNWNLVVKMGKGFERSLKPFGELLKIILKKINWYKT